jgi:hypothetical protein
VLTLAPAAISRSPHAVESGSLAWLDDMPTLAGAMQALPVPDPQFPVNGKIPGDEEMQIAAQIGTLVGLRRLMIYRSGVGELRRMPPRMREIAIGYLRAEHALGLRFRALATKGQGAFSSMCSNPNLQARLAFRQNMEQCAAEVFGRQVRTVAIVPGAHQKSFPRMFSVGRARELLELILKHGREMSTPESPGTTLLLPYEARYVATLDCATWGGDSDGDSLCDFWELLGVPAADGEIVPLESVYDYDKDGRLSAEERPDPLRKDVYVEVDWFEGEEPPAEAFDQVVAVFEGAPVKNPDRAQPRLAEGGPPGIRLHVALDEELEPDEIPAWVKFDPTITSLDFIANCRTAYTHFDSIKRCHFGTPTSRTLKNAAAVRQARINVYRYALYVNEIVETVDGVSPAAAEIGGNDMIYATDDVGVLGPFKFGHAELPASWICGEECIKLHATTFMHELGHLLGLRHGGGDDAACKPNYLGVMNYHEGYSGVLDYSRVALPTLNECALDESTGLRGQWAASDPRWPAARESLRGRTIAWGGANATQFQRAPADSYPIDWNGDGRLTPGLVAVDIDYLRPPKGDRLFFLEEQCAPTAKGLFVLPGHEDWSALRFDFRASRHFAEGATWHEAQDNVSPKRCR